MRKSIGVVSLALFLGALAACNETTPPPRGPSFDGLPPVRYQGDVELPSVIFTKDPAARCLAAGAEKHADAKIFACTILSGSRKVLVLENPCRRHGTYANELCHELGHIHGWPGDHPY